MDISWLGQSCFRIKGKNVSIVTDPYDPEMVGLKKLKASADIVTVSHGHGDHNNTGAVEGEPFVIEGAGEYEVKGVRIAGVQTFHDNKQGKERGTNTLYVLEVDGVIICHCGDLGHELTVEQLEQIEDVDVLLIPVGGTYTLDGTEAVKVINQIEPKVVIPMHYKLPEAKTDLKLADLDSFLHAYGAKSVEPMSKYTVTKDKLPAEVELIVLEV
jgi:L-ascorbate metabolism protein UlaG (beta-lactamase superfamily)